MPHHLNVIIDDDLYQAILVHAKRTATASKIPVTVSSDVRDLLRVALGTVPAERTRGWLEGRAEAWGALQRTVQEAVATLKPPKK